MTSLLGRGNYLKDCWGDEVYTVCNQVNVDMPVYIIENQHG